MESDRERILMDALIHACEFIQNTNQEYTVEQIFRHFVVLGTWDNLEDLPPNGRQDN